MMEVHTKPCKTLDPHSPHIWSMSAIDGDYYHCPGVPAVSHDDIADTLDKVVPGKVTAGASGEKVIAAPPMKRVPVTGGGFPLYVAAPLALLPVGVCYLLSVLFG